MSFDGRCEVGEAASEDQTCPICFEPWSSSGNHRLASLKCGHLFGERCIRRWIKGTRKECPQCNASAKKHDIRVLYAPSVVVQDNQGKAKLEEDLEAEREARQKAERNEAQARLECQLLKSELMKVKASVSQRPKVSHGVERQGPREKQESVEEMFRKKASSVVDESATARQLDFCASASMFVISKRGISNSQFGVLKISPTAMEHSQFIPVHNKLIKDLHAGLEKELVLTCSMDKTIKVTSLLTNSVVQSYSVSAPAWSCAWDCREGCFNRFYCGLQNGEIFVFDTRNTERPLGFFKPFSSPTPVISLSHIPSWKHLGAGSLLAVVPKDVLALETDEESLRSFSPRSSRLTTPSGSCFSSSCYYDEIHRGRCLISMRPTPEVPFAQHLVSSVPDVSQERDDTILRPSEETAERRSCLVQLGSKCTVLSRSCLMKHPNESDTLFAAIPNEDTKAVHIWNTKTDALHQRLDPCQRPIMHAKPFDQHHLATLTGRELNIYAWHGEK